jgi:hypothetical protein
VNQTYPERVRHQPVSADHIPQLATGERPGITLVPLGEHVLELLRHEPTLKVVHARIGAMLNTKLVDHPLLVLREEKAWINSDLGLVDSSHKHTEQRVRPQRECKSSGVGEAAVDDEH